MRLILIALLLVLAVGCQAEEDVIVPESINTIRTKHEASLMAKPGVVSVGIGHDNNGQAVIVIGVESQDKVDNLALPDELDGYPVKVQVMGTFRAQ